MIKPTDPPSLISTKPGFNNSAIIIFSENRNYLKINLDRMKMNTILSVLIHKIKMIKMIKYFLII